MIRILVAVSLVAVIAGCGEQTGASDSGSSDSGSVAVVDAGRSAGDAGAVDAGTVDAGTVDAGTIDAGAIDAGLTPRQRMELAQFAIAGDMTQTRLIFARMTVADALSPEVISSITPQGWIDSVPHDPGTTDIEAFAWLVFNDLTATTEEELQLVIGELTGSTGEKKAMRDALESELVHLRDLRQAVRELPKTPSRPDAGSDFVKARLTVGRTISANLSAGVVFAATEGTVAGRVSCPNSTLRLAVELSNVLASQPISTVFVDGPNAVDFSVPVNEPTGFRLRVASPQPDGGEVSTTCLATVDFKRHLAGPPIVIDQAKRQAFETSAVNFERSITDAMDGLTAATANLVITEESAQRLRAALYRVRNDHAEVLALADSTSRPADLQLKANAASTASERSLIELQDIISKKASLLAVMAGLLDAISESQKTILGNLED